MTQLRRSVMLVYSRMLLGLIIGAGIFFVAAIMGERHALYIPAVVLAVSAAASVFA